MYYCQELGHTHTGWQALRRAILAGKGGKGPAQVAAAEPEWPDKQGTTTSTNERGPWTEAFRCPAAKAKMLPDSLPAERAAVLFPVTIDRLHVNALVDRGPRSTS